MFVNEIRMLLLQNNPYRLLGVYANAPTKERLANRNRMKALLKVGKPVDFPLDLPQYFPSINRTDSLVAEAEAKLTLPQDRMFYAQFWFVKTSPLDEVAFNHLIAGEISKAEDIWQKKESASSLQNRIVCALINNDYANAIPCAEALYGNKQYVNQFVATVIGTGGNVDVANLPFAFLDTLCEVTNTEKLFSYITNNTWKKYIDKKAVKSLIDTIQNAIDTAKKSKGKGPQVRQNAGETLVKETKEALLQLKKYLSISDLQYQMIADKLGLEILQCGIDYFNESDDIGVAHKAMKLQKYAQTIVVGQMAKDRCNENVDILQKIIDNLPPPEVFAEDKAIRKELQKCSLLSDLIVHAESLLGKTRPHLQSIKKKLGASNNYYIQISTSIIKVALVKTIAEVNASNDNVVLKRAWKLTLLMDTFTIEDTFRNNVYIKNRKTLEEICERRGLIHKFSSEQSSYWQAALLLHIMCVVTGYFFANQESFDQESFDHTIFYWSIGIGTISWVYIIVDKSDGAGEFSERMLASRGGIILIPCFIGYWIYKGIRLLLDFIKSRL